MNWAIDRFDDSGKVTYLGKIYSQFYETEHVLEAQTIKRFFQTWMPQSAANTKDCTWIVANLLTNTQPYPGATEPVAKMVALELGSHVRQDRLAIFLMNSNRIKGYLFGSNPAVTQSYWNGLQAGDEQMMHLKDMGMVFTVSSRLAHRFQTARIRADKRVVYECRRALDRLL